MSTSGTSDATIHIPDKTPGAVDLLSLLLYTNLIMRRNPGDNFTG